eukprot:g1755.t1
MSKSINRFICLMSLVAFTQSKVVHLQRTCPIQKTPLIFATTTSRALFSNFTTTPSFRSTPKKSASLISRLSSLSAMGTDLAPATAPPGKELGTFAGGCFWGLELAFQRISGVESTTVGYTQGQTKNPSYEQVCTGATGHTEAVQVTYDPSLVQYSTLLDTFFEKTDPTTLNRQGGDAGTQYRSGIYYHTPEQKQEAEKAIREVQTKISNGQFRRTGGKEVVVELLSAGDYYLAEEYHQQYLEKGGRFNRPQSAAKGCKDPIRCYG